MGHQNNNRRSNDNRRRDSRPQEPRQEKPRHEVLHEGGIVEPGDNKQISFMLRRNSRGAYVVLEESRPRRDGMFTTALFIPADGLTAIIGGLQELDEAYQASLQPQPAVNGIPIDPVVPETPVQSAAELSAATEPEPEPAPAEEPPPAPAPVEEPETVSAD